MIQDPFVVDLNGQESKVIIEEVKATILNSKPDVDVTQKRIIAEQAKLDKARVELASLISQIKRGLIVVVNIHSLLY